MIQGSTLKRENVYQKPLLVEGILIMLKKYQDCGCIFREIELCANRLNWEVYRLTKILSENMTKWSSFFNIAPSLCNPHTSSIGVAVFGYNGQKMLSRADMA